MSTAHNATSARGAALVLPSGEVLGCLSWDPAELAAHKRREGWSVARRGHVVRLLAHPEYPNVHTAKQET